MSGSRLMKLKNILVSKIPSGNINYTVPDLWNAWNYSGEETHRLLSHELLVNPYRFYSEVISSYILPKAKTNQNYLESLAKSSNTIPEKGTLGGEWVKKSVLYSTMIRASSAWDHDRSYSLDVSNLDEMKETGTFVKMLALLPLLQKLGVDTMYLLPISRYSRKEKKGELGSPYGVASFYDIDPDLKDNLTGGEMTVGEEFQAFVEACHILGMRVVIDIIPRTNSVESDLIRLHPDWFYWIETKDYDKYRVPYVTGLANTIPPEAKFMPDVYASEDVQRHISMFRNDPYTENKELWNEIKDAEDIVEAIEKAYGLSVAPAFSDHINDVQPPWTDVTFFRMFLDHPSDNVKYLKNKNIPPYILFDTIKSNLFPGKKPNMPLWETLSGIIPYYQEQFGIDGARIDMGHALPKELLKMIISKAREYDPDFAFIAEELNPENAAKAKASDYNIIIGNGFWMEPRIWEKNLHKFVYGAKDVALPMFACAETHDTARIAGRDGGRELARMLTILNMLLPNLVPFINSGQEIYEIQPMNTGVDCTDKDKFNLPKDDLFYGKLALFDKYAFHYTSEFRWEIADHMQGIKEIRKRWLSQIMDPNASLPIYFNEFDTPAIGVAYFDKKTGKCILIAANSNPRQEIWCNASLAELRKKSGNENLSGNLVYSTYEMGRPYEDFTDDGRINLHLGGGEVKIIEF